MPTTALPLFDSHLHIIDERFEVVANNGYRPPSFTCDDYRARLADYDLRGGAIVSGSFQAFDQAYLLDALARLGPGFVGVTQLPDDVEDDTILSLAARGVRALRFNFKRGGGHSPARLEHMARRVHDLAGWHVELYIDSRELAGLRALLPTLPAVSIDHLGLSEAGLDILVELAGKGIRIKATGFGRLDFPVERALQAIHAANPEALMFGSDLPSTRAPRPFEERDIARIVEALGKQEARRVLHDNARAFYRLQPFAGDSDRRSGT